KLSKLEQSSKNFRHKRSNAREPFCSRAGQDTPHAVSKPLFARLSGETRNGSSTKASRAKQFARNWKNLTSGGFASHPKGFNATHVSVTPWDLPNWRQSDSLNNAARDFT